MSFEGRIAAQRAAIEGEQVAREQDAAKKDEQNKLATEEAKKHPIFQEMRDIANSPELEEALQALVGTLKSDEDFDLKISDNETPNDNSPYGSIRLWVVTRAWIKTISDNEGNPIDKQPQSEGISVEIGYYREGAMVKARKESSTSGNRGFLTTVNIPARKLNPGLYIHLKFGKSRSGLRSVDEKFKGDDGIPIP